LKAAAAGAPGVSVLLPASESQQTFLLLADSCPPAGIAGYTWVAVLHYWLGLSYTATLLLANVMPVAWLAVFHLGLQRVKPGQLSKAGVDYQPLPVTAAAESPQGEPLQSRCPELLVGCMAASTVPFPSQYQQTVSTNGSLLADFCQLPQLVQST
jgi:hypothetical protein